MTAQNATLDASAHPSKAELARRGRRVREDPQDDSSTATQNNPPNHGVPTHGVGRFLWEVPKDTPLDDLGDLYDRWNDETQQVDLAGWSE